ncbi:VanZ family protein [Photobacterium sp. BZF1]|uniref:VanZ family protein n=1 Tax=Photobacterium sp. BZF1 TaxID=1904457 RepID=UPI00351CA917
MTVLKFSTLVIYSLFIGYVSLLDNSSPTSNVPSIDSFGISHLDKILHLGAYGLFASIAVLTFKNKVIQYLSCLFIIIFSALLEYFQSTIYLRQPSLTDFLANCIGVILGLVLINYLSPFLSKKFVFFKHHL